MSMSPPFLAWLLVSIGLAYLTSPVLGVPGQFAFSVLFWVTAPIAIMRWIRPANRFALGVVAAAAGAIRALVSYWELGRTATGQSELPDVPELAGARDGAASMFEVLESTGSGGLAGLAVAGAALSAIAGVTAAFVLMRWIRTRIKNDQAFGLVSVSGTLAPAIISGFGPLALVYMIAVYLNSRPWLDNRSGVVAEFLGHTLMAVVAGLAPAVVVGIAYIMVHRLVGVFHGPGINRIRKGGGVRVENRSSIVVLTDNAGVLLPSA